MAGFEVLLPVMASERSVAARGFVVFEIQGAPVQIAVNQS